MVEQTKNTCAQVFGKRLRELRKENGYTIEQFADMVGISKSTLGYYENDKRMPDIEILARIARITNPITDTAAACPLFPSVNDSLYRYVTSVCV